MIKSSDIYSPLAKGGNLSSIVGNSTYENSMHRVRFQYPNYWESVTEESMPGDPINKFVQFNGSRPQQVPDSLFISIHIPTNGLVLLKYMSFRNEYLSNNFPGFHLLNASLTESPLLGKGMYRLVYDTSLNENLDFKVVEYGIMDYKDKLIMLQFTEESSQFVDFLPNRDKSLLIRYT